MTKNCTGLVEKYLLRPAGIPAGYRCRLQFCSKDRQLPRSRSTAVSAGIKKPNKWSDYRFLKKMVETEVFCEIFLHEKKVFLLVKTNFNHHI
jgi:hypothetical protein